MIWPIATSTGRLAATTMIANTNSGSVKLRLSMYAIAACGPSMAMNAETSAAAHSANTISTSASAWISPAWRG